MTTHQDIPVSDIDVPAGRRVLDPNWVEALAADISTRGQQTAIEVVVSGDRFRLVAGAHRLAAFRRNFTQTISAIVKPADAYASEAEIKLAEIAENFMRRELSVLDRAMDVAAWREIYETAKGAVKRGGDRRGKSKSPVDTLIGDDDLERQSEAFSCTFSEAIQHALGLGHASIFRLLKIATLDEQVRQQISLHPIADNRTELLTLVATPVAQQGMVAQLVVSGQAANVAAALAVIQKTPAPQPLKPWARLSEGFGRLKPTEQDNFFDLHADAIARWQAKRGV